MKSLHNTLKEYFGFSSFRPGQEEIISQALAGNDVIVLMPTGGGKSICYQIPALMKPGCAIVISPLIALMDDQVATLRANGIPAAAIHSNRDENLNQADLQEAARGNIKLLYISPERFMLGIDHIAAGIPVSLVAVDEAHCISQWGHDFRPVYKELRIVKEKFPGIPVMALTATADRLIRSDISASLLLDHPYTHIGSFDRPNISLSVLPDPGKQKRLRIISGLIEKYPLGAGIVYCLSRKKTEAMHEALSGLGYRSVCYHAGLLPQQRQEAQAAFTRGDVQVVCATVAFGMGIDKSNIRWVVHNNIPANIESYYQEIGRAGRDGLPAEAIMFYNFSDIITRRSFLEHSARPEIEEEKLKLMQRYAEASVCRRRILLSYFSEETTEDCGHCDNCLTTRKSFDGSVLAQMALSAVIRVNAREGIQSIIDILRASARKEIIVKGYHLLPTYGVGRQLSSAEWYAYIMQMIQLGVFEVGYDDNFHLKPTDLGMKVLRGQQPLQLIAFEPVNLHKKKTEEKKEKKSLSPEDKLSAELLKLRKKLAAEENIGDYAVFSDASIEEMVRLQPEDIEVFAAISGVSKAKLAKYGKRFLSVIRKHKGLKANPPVGTSQKETLIMFDSGMSPEEIAQLKNISVATVYNHLIQWIEEGKVRDFHRLRSERDFKTVSDTYASDPEKAFERLVNEFNIPGHIVRLVLAEKRMAEP